MPAVWDPARAAYSIQSPLYPGNLYLPNLTVTAGVQLKASTSKCTPPWSSGGVPGPCVVEYSAAPSSPAATDITWCRYRDCRIDVFAGTQVVLQLNGIDPQLDPNRVRAGESRHLDTVLVPEFCELCLTCRDVVGRATLVE